MATNMPGAVDAPSNPSSATLQNASGFEHDLQHDNVNDGLLAVERIVVGPTWVNVKSDQCGAKGDGTTDDTAAFTTALGAGNNIYVPSGNYKVSSITHTVTGQRLLCAGRAQTSFLISDVNGGIFAHADQCELADCTVTAFSGVNPNALVTLDGGYGLAINRPRLTRVTIDGVDKANNAIGLYIKGVYNDDAVAGLGCYNGVYDQLLINHCGTGLQAYTVNHSTGLAVSDTTKQRNASHTFLDAHIINCTTGIKANTALNYLFVGWDVESNTTGVNVVSIQSWAGLGYGPSGNTTDWTGTGIPEVVLYGGSAPSAFINGGGQVFGLATSGAGAKGANIITKLWPGRHPDDPGNLSRVWALGLNERVYNYEATSAVSSSGSTTTTGALYTPNTTEVASSTVSTYHVSVKIVGVERSSGDSGSIELKATFKATNVAGTITVAQVGSTTTVHSALTNAGWGATLGIDGGATSFRPVVHGAAGDGTIDWEIWTEVVCQRGA